MPIVTMVTTPPLVTVQIPVDCELNVTPKPELADAVTVKVDRENARSAGAANVTVCGALTILRRKF